MKQYVTGANPYMPLWEHVPDGEPRVFEYNGEKRVYVYGSHDTMRSVYCGNDYVVWSAPVTDLTNWRCDGVAFCADNILYAPDVVKKGDKYYMYIAMNKGSEIYVAESDSPVGPFLNPRKTDFGFDIGVLVDDDGRCYAYWGFKKCFAAEINDDMATIKEGTLKTNMIPHCGFRDNLWDTDNIDDEFSYFEAASIRKVFGKYVFIYSKRDMVGDISKAKQPSVNAYLDYAYSDNPLSDWIHGGTIISNTGQIIENKDGTKKRAYHKCNNHGSIEEIDGKWYIFYHRGTGTNECARQAMLEPIDAAMDKKGNIYLGKIFYDNNNEPYKCEEAEMTSQGAQINGINASEIISAGYTCYIDTEEGDGRAYIRPIYDKNNSSSPVVNIKNKTVIGFKYINFSENPVSSLCMRIKNDADVNIKMMIDDPESEPCGNIKVEEKTDYKWIEIKLEQVIMGKHSVYFSFDTVGVCEFDCFTFCE